MPLMDVSTGRVIKEVQMRPVIWDSSHDNYKNKHARQKAWHEIFCELIPEFLTLPVKEKKDTERAIQQRWKTARDAYMRCKSLLKAGTIKKKYFYYDYFSFLEKNAGESSEQPISTSPPSAAYDPLEPSSCDKTVMKQEHNDEDSEEEFNEREDDYNEQGHDFNETENNYLEPEIDVSPQEDDAEEPRPKIRKLMKRNFSSNGVNKELLKIYKDNSARMKNDNMSFFMSMLPIVNKFSDQQKLMFRSEVIRVAMEIRSKRE